MASLPDAMPFLLDHEGGKSQVPGDAGGRTNRGITEAALAGFNLAHPECGLPADPWDLTLGQTFLFYSKAGYWFYDGIEDQRVATKVFDLGVNFGDRTEVKMLQVCVGTVPDGVFGPATCAAVNAEDPDQLLQALCDAAAARYEEIEARNPGDAKFMADWLRRAKDLPHG